MNTSERIAYVNARLRARKANLIGGRQLARWATGSDPEYLCKQLAETGYRQALGRLPAGAGPAARRVEVAVQQELASCFAQVRQMLGSCRPAGSYLFGRWDVDNLKTVLRGVQAGAAPDRVVEACTPLGWIAGPVWAELAHSTDLAAAVDRAVTLDLGYRQPLRDGWRRFRDSGALADLEHPLERAFYASARRAVPARSRFWTPLAKQLEFDIDVHNLSTATEWLLRGERPDAGLLLPGGAQTTARFGRALDTDPRPRQLLATAVRRRLGRLGEAAALQLAAGDLGPGQRALAHAAWRQRSGQLRGPPLSLAIVIGFVWAKLAEASDLRRIAWGHHWGEPPEQIRADLITPVPTPPPG